MQQRKSLSLTFRVHQPVQLERFRFFDRRTPGNFSAYFLGEDGHKKSILHKTATLSYYPANTLLLNLLESFPYLTFSFAFSGVALEQMGMYDTELLESFRELVNTNKVELLSQTYYHSPSWYFSKAEFADQVRLHRNIIWKHFRRKPKVFSNAGEVAQNEMVQFIRKLGYSGLVAQSGSNASLPTLAITSDNRNPLVDELAAEYRFSARTPESITVLFPDMNLSTLLHSGFKQTELSAAEFADKVAQSQGDNITLLLDYEVLGLYNSENSGIFEFLQQLPEELYERGIQFSNPSELVSRSNSHIADTGIPEMHLPRFNKMQDEAIRQLYRIEAKIQEVEHKYRNLPAKKSVRETWRKLQSTDHFDYMTTEGWEEDTYLNLKMPYDSPYDAYINYMNVLNDFTGELEQLAG